MTHSDTYMASIKEGCLMNSEAGLSVFLMNNNIQVGEAAEVVYYELFFASGVKPLPSKDIDKCQINQITTSEWRRIRCFFTFECSL